MKKNSSTLLEITPKLLVVFAIVFVYLNPIALWAQDSKVSLNLSQVTLNEVFKEIEALTDYTFIYKDKIINNTGLVNLNTNNEVLSSVLDRLFENLSL